MNISGNESASKSPASAKSILRLSTSPPETKDRVPSHTKHSVTPKDACSAVRDIPYAINSGNNPKCAHHSLVVAAPLVTTQTESHKGFSAGDK
jgi:hypothetical protein